MSLGRRNGDASYPKYNYSFTLSTKEKECVEKFLICIGASSAVPANEIQAFRFLAARKFNINEAVELFHAHENFLKAEDITAIDPFDQGVRRELLSGKFTILNDNDPSGARVAQFFVRLHRSARSTHKAFLQSVMFQLSASLRKETAVRNGIILIYDMTNSKYSNFDADLSKKLFNMLKSYYPIRLRRIIVLTAPLWFRAPFHLLRVFIKEELRDRVHVLRPSPGSRLASLSNPDPVIAQKEHFAWLLSALSETVATPNSLFCSPSFAIHQSSGAISAFFDTSTSGSVSESSTIDRSGRSSSSASEAGEDVSTTGGVSTPSSGLLTEDEGLMAELGCWSPNWDPFALSSSQSSDVESTGLPVNSSVSSARSNVMSMSCSPVLSAAPITAIVNGEISPQDMPCANKLVQEPLRDPAGTPTPPAIPRFNGSGNGSCLDSDLASTSASENSPSAVSCTGSKHLHCYTSSMRRVLVGAPLASQDDFVISCLEENTINTIRKEKRSKQAAASPSVSIAEPTINGPLSSHTHSDIVPSWALNRPFGLSIHVGPHSKSKESQQSAESNEFSCIGEGVSAIHSPPTSPRLRSHILQTSPTQTESNPARTQVGGLLNDNDTDQAVEVFPDDEEDDEDDYYCTADVADLDFDSLWMTVDQLINHVAERGASGLIEEYSAVCSIKSNDTCTAFRRPCNSSKNRYVDVTCLEHSRVQLHAHLPTADQRTSLAAAAAATTTTSQGEQTTANQTPIYIHANWVDSYRQRNAFICTQGPLQETTGDFWCMTWTYNVPAIVMITRCYESQRCKCFPYWPPVEGQSLRFTAISSSSNAVVTTGFGGGSGTMASSKKKSNYGLPRRSSSEVSNSSKLIFEVTHVSSNPGEDYTRTKLQLKNVKSGQSRIVEHYAFHSWPDHGVPSESSALLELLVSVQEDYAATINRELNYTTAYDSLVPPPPIVVHCSAGIGRTGTFVALDICTKQLKDLGVVNVPLTVARIRSQRSGCVQVSAQYLFVYRALVDFAIALGLLNSTTAGAVARQLTTPARTSMPSVLVSSLPATLPMDASLFSVLTANVNCDSSGTARPAHLSALMRFLRNHMTAPKAGIESTNDHRISTELDYETEEFQAMPQEADDGDDGESKLAEVSSEEEDMENNAATLRSDVHAIPQVANTIASAAVPDRPAHQDVAPATGESVVP